MNNKCVLTVNSTNITHHYIDNIITCEILFNIITKNFQLYFINIEKYINIKIIIGPKYSVDETSLWYTINRPVLTTHFSVIENIRLISDNEIDLLKHLINTTLKVCRDTNMRFDTDKDIRRKISLKLSTDWYPYPG